MSEIETKVEATIREAAGYICEEVGEAVNSDVIAIQCRRLRNEGRIANGKTPMLTPPGTLNDKKDS